jgi:hypothetical protein
MSEIKVSWHLEVPRETRYADAPAHQPPQPPPTRRSSHHMHFRSPPTPQRKPRLTGCGTTAAPDRPPKPTHRALAAVTKRTKEQATRSTHLYFCSTPNPLTPHRKPRLAGCGDTAAPERPPNRPTVHWPQ